MTVQSSNRRYLQSAMDAAGLPERWRGAIWSEADRRAKPGEPMMHDESWLSHQVVALEKLARGHVPIDASSQDVMDRAATLAESVAEAARVDWSADWNARAIVREEGEEWPGLPRATDARWWRRRITASLNRRTEDAARDLMQVGGRGKPSYVSEETHARYLTAKRASDAAIDGAYIDEINEGMAAPCMMLRDAVDASVSNPVIRLAELITRARGMEEIADERGDVGLFWTWTLSSRWHATRRDGTGNHRWNGSTVRECADELLGRWKWVQDKARRLGLLMYGVRVMEPHNDGTPHAHALIWCPREQVSRVKALVYRSFLRDEETIIPFTFAHSHRHRVKCKPIDKAKGNAVGYLVKYLTKNITDEHGLNANHRGISRVKAWASAHAIRQFQFIGGPSITTWREARRMTTDDAMQCEQFALAFDAVHRVEPDETDGEVKQASFAKFIRLQGGIACPRSARPIQPFTAADKVNKYGERPARVVGLQCGSALALTHKREFAIRWAGHGRTGTGSPSRTRFNNFAGYRAAHGSDVVQVDSFQLVGSVGLGFVDVPTTQSQSRQCQGFRPMRDSCALFLKNDST